MNHRVFFLFISSLVILVSGIGSTPTVQALNNTAAEPAGLYRVFLPTLATPVNPLAPDLTLISVELTQGVQSTGADVPMVASRTTLVRAYVQDNKQLHGNATVSLIGLRDGHPLPGSPLAQTQTLTSDSAANTYESTFNFSLPPQWVMAGNIDLYVTVSANSEHPETNLADNTLNITATFVPVAPLELVIVPIEYTHTPTGQVFAPPAHDNISDFILASFPVPSVNVTMQTPVQFSGDLKTSTSWLALLQMVTALKNDEKANAGTVYLGYVDGHQGWWGYSGIAGYAWVGGTCVATTLDLWYSEADTQRIAAHEVGHTFGRRHAPCGTTGDVNYPYPNGQIGIYGVNLSESRVYTPNNPDIMGYCGNAWFSDYSYMGLMESQLRYTEPAGNSESLDQSSLLVRASFGEAGNATLLPTYTMQSSPAQYVEAEPESESYEIVLRDANGAVIARHTVQTLIAPEEANVNGHDDDHEHEEEHYFQALNTLIPLPNRPVSTLELVQNGVVLSSQTVNTTAQIGPVSLQSNPLQLRQRSSQMALTCGDNSPAIVRFTDSNCQQTTLAVDVTAGQFVVPTSLINESGTFTVQSNSGNFSLVNQP